MKESGKLIVAKGFKKLPKVQKIAKSGHTGWEYHSMADFLFAWKSNCYSLKISKAAESKQNKQEVSCTVTLPHS